MRLHTALIYTLLLFAIFSVTMPVAAQYDTLGLLLVYCLCAWAVRKFPPMSLPTALRPAVKPLLWGLAGFAFFLTLSFAVGALADAGLAPVKDGLKETIRLITKTTVFPLAALFLVSYFALYRIELPRIVLPLTAMIGLYVGYCVLQRYTGVNWSQGFAGRIGLNRFAYDVFRVSGFMGHPLTFAINLLIFGVTLTWYATLRSSSRSASGISPSLSCPAQPVRRSFREGGSTSGISLLYLSIAGVAAMFLFSNSRWPLLCLLMIALVSLRRRLWYWQTAAIAGAAAVFLIVEGSIIGRLKELFSGGFR